MKKFLKKLVEFNIIHRDLVYELMWVIIDYQFDALLNKYGLKLVLISF